MSRVERNQKYYDEPEEKKTGSVFGTLLSIIGLLILIASLLVSIGLAAPRLAGINSYVVISGSMEPDIPVGSLVFSRKCDPETLVEGDVIVFNNSTGGTMPITHRVVLNDTGNREIITKGDANDQEDMVPVGYEDVIGKVVMHLPKAGYIASPISTPLGKIAMAMLILAGYLLTEAGARIRRKK